jgi:BolA protein
LIDDSAKHAATPAPAAAAAISGWRSSRRASPDCKTMERHRLVYDALGPLMKREIHAVSITAKTPDEN